MVVKIVCGGSSSSTSVSMFYCLSGVVARMVILMMVPLYSSTLWLMRLRVALSVDDVLVLPKHSYPLLEIPDLFQSYNLPVCTSLCICKQ